MSSTANSNGAPGQVSQTPVAQLGYTEASRELDEIVVFFEQRDVDVDQLVARLQRATAIVDELDRRLRCTRMQVEELVPRLTALAGAREPGDSIEEIQEAPADGEAPICADEVEGEPAAEVEGSLAADELEEPIVDELEEEPLAEDREHDELGQLAGAWDEVPRSLSVPEEDGGAAQPLF